jgi:hypothetical protein
MINNIINAVGLISMAVVVANAYPVKLILSYIYYKIENSNYESIIINKTLQFIYDNFFIIEKLFECAMCLAFWIGLIYYQNILYASIIALLSNYIDRTIKTHNI